MAISPAAASNTVTLGADTAIASVDLASLFTAGNLVPASTDYAVRSGYIDYSFRNVDTQGHSIYILEYMHHTKDPAVPPFTNGLQDAAELNFLFTQKRVLGITHSITIPAGWTKMLRLKLSKTNVLVNNGYDYYITLYSDYTSGANAFLWKPCGGKLYWDRIV